MIDMILEKPNNCPYCREEIIKFPARKTKCKSCGKYYYAKRMPGENKKRIVTEKEAEQIEKQWEEESFINKWCDFFQEYGFTKIYIENQIKRSKIKRDSIWSLFQKALATVFERDKLHEASCLYYSMALFVDEENKNPFEYLKLSTEMKLRDLKKSRNGDTQIKILSPGGCDSCRKINGKVYTIDEAIKKMPIPNKNCSHRWNKYSFCRCIYVPNGRFI